jgi:hypothetical protein
MNLRKSLVVFVILAAAWVTPSSAQVFWSNYSSSAVTDDIWCVTYANGTFAAVTNQGNLITSNNGLSWSSEAIDPGVWLVSIAYGNGIWVVVGDKGSIFTSADLKTWASVAPVTSNKLNGVYYTGTAWIAVGEIGTIVSSPDGKNWTVQPAVPGVTGFLHGITYGGPLSPVTPTSTGSVLVSGQGGVLLQGAANGQGFTLLGTSGTAQNLEAVLEVTSPGLNNGDYTTVAVGAAGTALLANQDNYAFSSEDGPAESWTHWINATLNPSATFRGLSFGDGYFIAAGDSGSIFSSTDGMNWTQCLAGDSPSTLSTATLLSAAYSSQLQRFVVTGTGGAILVSNPVPTVFGNVSTRGYVSSTQTFIGGFVIQGTAPRNVLIRGDGPALGAFGVSGPLPDPVLTVYNTSGTVVSTNTGWTTNANPGAIATAALEAGAFALPNPSLDSALLLTLQPGAYTVQITSAKGNSGIALFEAYTN